jgi:hypothetical protein
MKKVFVAVLAGAGIVGGAAVASAEGPSRFDGRWTVSMVTASGACDRSYNYALAVENGRVQPLPKAGESAPRMTGQVAPSGAVALSISSGIASGNAAGRLRASAGSGTWEVPIAGCTGTWVAQKSGTTQTAQR